MKPLQKIRLRKLEEQKIAAFEHAVKMARLCLMIDAYNALELIWKALKEYEELRDKEEQYLEEVAFDELGPMNVVIRKNPRDIYHELSTAEKDLWDQNEVLRAWMENYR